MNEITMFVSGLALGVSVTSLLWIRWVNTLKNELDMERRRDH